MLMFKDVCVVLWIILIVFFGVFDRVASGKSVSAVVNAWKWILVFFMVLNFFFGIFICNVVVVFYMKLFFKVFFVSDGFLFLVFDGVFVFGDFFVVAVFFVLRRALFGLTLLFLNWCRYLMLFKKNLFVMYVLLLLLLLDFFYGNNMLKCLDVDVVISRDAFNVLTTCALILDLMNFVVSVLFINLMFVNLDWIFYK